jgi:hypothetical protein
LRLGAAKLFRPIPNFRIVENVHALLVLRDWSNEVVAEEILARLESVPAEIRESLRWRAG